MMIGPLAARSLGLHPTWSATFAADGGVAGLWPTSTGVFVLDARNELSMLDFGTGVRKWRAFVADPGDQVLDLHVSKEANVAIVLRSDAIVTVDLNSGIPKGMLKGVVKPMQRLQWLARTGGSLAGREFIYGSLGGEVVWHSWWTGLSKRAHRIGRRVAVSPIVAGDLVIAGANDGVVSALNVETGALVWTRTLLGELAAEPVATDTHVWTSTQDQYIRCLSLKNEGRPVWEALMESPLVSAPTLVGSSVYQQVPGVGLTAWEAAPENKPSGVQIWTSPGVDGDVLTTTGDSLLTWQWRTGALSTVSPTTGTLDAALNLPLGTHVKASSTDDGRVFVIGADGRIESLVPAS